jgi:hypothetical protein
MCFNGRRAMQAALTFGIACHAALSLIEFAPHFARATEDPITLCKTLRAALDNRI